MTAERIGESLQESVLAVLAFNQDYGNVVAAQVAPEDFDGVYHEIASVVLAYRRKYHRAPGNAHLESLFSREKLDPSDRKTHILRRTLVGLAATAEAINAEYIAHRTQDHVREQRLKAALLQANERYLQGGDATVQEVEGILHGALRFRQQTLDAGTFLTEVKKSSVFLEEPEPARSLGIPELDRYGIGPASKRLLLYIAPKNSGKSWFCVHVGRQCLMQKDRVLHVSLEMTEQELLDRYYQSFFSIASKPEKYVATSFELDELERYVASKVRHLSPKTTFRDQAIKKLLRKKVEAWGSRFKRLVIKDFPSGTLTMQTLRGYLDYLELAHKFIPTVLIVDYPDLFQIDRRDYRLSLGRIFVELRGLGNERNLAVVAPTQSNRDSIGAKRVNSTNVTEDISKVFTADTVLTYSQTEAELAYGTARLSVDHARNAPKGQRVLLSQSYATGQYVLDSVALNNAYWDWLGSVAANQDGAE